MSSGNSTLGSQLGTGTCERDLREAFDQCELMFDLSPIGLCLFLGLLELVGRGVLLEGDLTSSALIRSLKQGLPDVVERHGGRVGCTELE